MSECKSKYCGCLYHSANALSRIITRMAEEEFALTGLTPSYAFVIMSVYEKPGIQPLDLSREMQLKPSTITRLIEKLELRGLLVRKARGKYTEVHPTKDTKTAYDNVKKSWRNLYERYSGILGEEEGKELNSMINKAIEELEE